MNKVILIGRLTKDVEVKEFGESKIAKFPLAVTRQFKKDEADFINCTAFNKQAEIIAQFFKKGSPIAITGNIRTGSYEKDGSKVYTTDVIIENFEFIGSKNDNSNQNKSENDSGFNDEMMPEDDGDCPF